MNRLVLIIGLILLVGLSLSTPVAASATCIGDPYATSCIDGIYDQQPWAPQTHWFKLGPIIIG